jgi:hypothetical protein
LTPLQLDGAAAQSHHERLIIGISRKTEKGFALSEGFVRECGIREDRPGHGDIAASFF